MNQDLYRFIHYINMFYFYLRYFIYFCIYIYLRYLNLIAHKVLSAGVEIAVSPLLCRDKLVISVVQTGK